MFPWVRSLGNGVPSREVPRKGRVVLAGILVLTAASVEVRVAPGQAKPAPQAGAAALKGILDKPWTGDFDEMVKRRRIRILTPYSKTHYFIDKGVQRGLVYEGGLKLEEDINKKLKTTPATRVAVVFIPTSRDDLYQALVDGRGDIVAASVTVTPERARLVDFTNPTKTGVREIVVTGPGAPAINSVDDLSGTQVAVRDKSIQFESLTALNATFQKQGKAAVSIKVVPTALEDEDILEMVNAGLLKTVIVDDFMAQFWKQILPSITLHPEVSVREDGSLAWAVRKNSPKLIAELNPLIKANGLGTLFGNAILRKYLKSAKFVKDATSETERKKFESLIEIFRKYSAQYDLDFLLMIAQGYQESRLDHSAKSHVGAVGIMQVMPQTAGDLKVGDITKVEPNVHAGVKYIRFMIDQYFADEPMDRLNKGLFAFAAYNAGPGRVRQLRREATQRGLNANVWFNNVERVAGERIGRETVQYVSNIYKYYVAYTLAFQEIQEKKGLTSKGFTP
jgi:membrane-bound lytic murein transglycosylase MltF